jgi:Fur family ferric uptake transcriptional regulator
MVKPAAERNTPQKRAIREVFERARHPLTTVEILSEAKSEIRSLGIATVYRSIRTLLDEGYLTAVEVPGHAPLYERAGKGHHHHFFCSSCERVFELDGCSSAVTVAVPRGFQATGHEVTIYGSCPACSRASARRRTTRRT